MTEKEMRNLKPGDLLHMFDKPLHHPDLNLVFETFGVVTEVVELSDRWLSVGRCGINVLWNDYYGCHNTEIFYAYDGSFDVHTSSTAHVTLVREGQ